MQKQIYLEKWFLVGTRALRAAHITLLFILPVLKHSIPSSSATPSVLSSGSSASCDRGPWSLVPTESCWWALTPSPPHANLEQARLLLGFGCCLLGHDTQVCPAWALCPEPHTIILTAFCSFPPWWPSHMQHVQLFSSCCLHPLLQICCISWFPSS